jgi:dihydropyrimidinase
VPISTEPFDLVVRGGRVVTADSLFEVDLAIRGGTIAQIGGRIEAEAEIDAAGKTIFPGGVDMHVHLTPVELRRGHRQLGDDFASGSRAAAAGGSRRSAHQLPAPGRAPRRCSGG